MAGCACHHPGVRPSGVSIRAPFRPTDFRRGRLLMGVRAWNVALLMAMGALWLASGTQREKPVIEGESQRAAVRTLEAEVAATRRTRASHGPRPGLPRRTRPWAGGPSARVVAGEGPHRPGRRARVRPRAPRAGPLRRGAGCRARVLAACDPASWVGGAEPGSGVAFAVSGCDTWLLASASRRADILERLVELGVDDTQAHPEVSFIAYHNARARPGSPFNEGGALAAKPYGRRPLGLHRTRHRKAAVALVRPAANAEGEDAPRASSRRPSRWRLRRTPSFASSSATVG